MLLKLGAILVFLLSLSSFADDANMEKMMRTLIDQNRELLEEVEHLSGVTGELRDKVAGLENKDRNDTTHTKQPVVEIMLRKDAFLYQKRRGFNVYKSCNDVRLIQGDDGSHRRNPAEKDIKVLVLERIECVTSETKHSEAGEEIKVFFKVRWSEKKGDIIIVSELNTYELEE
jgi:hypothetical protein